MHVLTDDGFLDINELQLRFDRPATLPAQIYLFPICGRKVPPFDGMQAARKRDLLHRFIHMRDRGCDVDGTVWNLDPDDVIESINVLECELRPRLAVMP